MNRLLVAFLAAVDALIAAAVGVAAALAPLTVFWVLGLGGTADWGALWPASVRLWQFGNLVPLQITLPPEYLTAVGIDADGATFWLSLAPLAFAGFAALFAARSGARAARAGAWAIGVLAGRHGGHRVVAVAHVGEPRRGRVRVAGARAADGRLRGARPARRTRGSLATRR